MMLRCCYTPADGGEGCVLLVRNTKKDARPEGRQFDHGAGQAAGARRPQRLWKIDPRGTTGAPV